MIDEQEIFSPIDEAEVQQDANDIVIFDSEEEIEEEVVYDFGEDFESEPEVREEIPLLQKAEIVSGPYLSLDAWLDWKKESDSLWTYYPRYLVNGKEKLVGARRIGGVRYAVFWCLDDTFLAQRYDGDVERGLYVPEGRPEDRPVVQGPPPPENNEGAIRFVGKNFKLAGLRKWRIVMPREKLGSMRYLCEHQMETRIYKVYSAEDGSFVAFPNEDNLFLV